MSATISRFLRLSRFLRGGAEVNPSLKKKPNTGRLSYSYPGSGFCAKSKKSEKQSLDDALSAAQHCLKQCHRILDNEQAKLRAEAGLQSLEAVIAAGFAADNGIKQFVRAVIALEQAAVSVAGVASRPSRELVRVAIKHALFHQLVPIRHLLGAEFPVASIPQNQRKPLNEYCIQWERGIRQALQAVIDGKPEPIIDDEIDEVEYVEKMQNGHDQESL